MAYRIYFFDSAGYVARRIDLDCRNDDHAIAAASEYINGEPMELWHFARFVRRFGEIA
jgi:hypothetical protein